MDRSPLRKVACNILLLFNKSLILIISPTMDNHHPSFLFSLLLLTLLFSTSFAEDDVRCLQEVKNSLTDPQSSLSSWTFTNTSNGFICSFAGVSCYKENRNRVIGLDLREFGVGGNIPDSLQVCNTLQTLQLAGNSLSGSIPPLICDWFPYLTSLDLSNNALTGQIPKGLAKCSYLKTLVLDGNKLSGRVPYQITSLRRLRRFSVANNELSGMVPVFNHPVDVNYTGNIAVCNGFGEQMRWLFWWIEQNGADNILEWNSSSEWRGLHYLLPKFQLHQIKPKNSE